MLGYFFFHPYKNKANPEIKKNPEIKNPEYIFRSPEIKLLNISDTKLIYRRITPIINRIIPIIPIITISIHQHHIDFDSLKHLWASLYSKAQLLGCVFDTPDGDALPITYGGVL